MVHVHQNMGTKMVGYFFVFFFNCMAVLQLLGPPELRHLSKVSDFPKALPETLCFAVP